MYAVVFIPDFSLQCALRYSAELHARPVALVDSALARPLISQVTDEARRCGVVAGMSPTQALARCAGVRIKNRSRAQEKMVTQALLQCAYSFSPRIEATAEGVCTLDLQGLALLSERWDATPAATAASLREWADLLRQAIAHLELAARIGVARTPTLALLAAQTAAPIRIVEDAAAFVQSLPVAQLDPSPAVASIIHNWGIRTVAEFVALGKDRLIERLGGEALELFERASTDFVRPLQCIVPPEEFAEQIEFEREIELLEPLLFILRRFLEQLVRRFEMCGQVVRQLTLRLDVSAGPRYERVLVVPAPTRQVDILFRMLHTHLEQLRMAHPIVGASLAAEPCRPFHQQFGLFEASLRDPNQFYETIARLTSLLGPERVGVPRREASHRPDAFVLAPVDFGIDRKSGEASASPEPGLAPEPLGLPLRRLRPPLEARVELQDARPAAFESGRYRGKIRAARGPWRASGDWWDRSRWQREEWDVQTVTGGLYRLFREADRWFVEGMYD